MLNVIGSYDLKKNIPIPHALSNSYLSIFLIQIVSSLGFSVLYSTLVLYLQNKLGMEVQSANSIVGVFLAFNYTLHILGGVWGGRLFSNRVLFCIGMFAQFVGCVLISVENTRFLYYGLAVFLTGSGLNVTCLNCILTQRFAPDDNRRETVFIWNYSGMSLGFFIGYSLSGFYQISQNYHTLFLLSSLGNLFAIAICLLNWKQLADINTIYSKLSKSKQISASLFGVICTLLLPVLLYQMFRYAQWSNAFILVVGVLMLLLTLFIAKQQYTIEAENKIKACAVFMVVSAIFWMLYQIGPMGLTIFTEYNVRREYFSWVIPPQWFQNINTFSIVIGGPVLAFILTKLRNKGVQISLPAQFALALFFIALAFMMLPIGVAFANKEGMVSPGWIVAYYFLQCIGEMLISPVGYAMIGSLVPASQQGLMMGMLMMYCGVGAALASYCSNIMVSGQESTVALLTNAGYSQVFLLLGVFGLICSVLLFMFVKKLRELAGETNVYLPLKNAHFSEKEATL